MISPRYVAMLPGLLFCGLIAYLATYLEKLSWLQSSGLSALTVAILLGMLFGNTLYSGKVSKLAAGVYVCKHFWLRMGIVLFGFRLTLEDITHVGIEGVVSGVLVLCSTFLLALLVGIKFFKLRRDSVILMGVGSSICGAAAIMAAEGEIDARAEDVSVAVATVVVFGSIGIFLYPWLYQINLTEQWISTNSVAFGIYAGSTLHEVAQVVAAGMSINPEVADVAVIAKMVRVMMLAPFLLLLPLFCRKPITPTESQKKPFPIPWFAFLFIGVILLNSMQLIPTPWVSLLVAIDTILLAMAMAALGITTHLSAVRNAGLKPLLLALVLFSWLVMGGALINRLVFWL